MKKKLSVFALPLLALPLLTLTGCGGGGGETDEASDARTPRETAQFVATCASLGGRQIPASAIGRPSNGAVVDSAVFHSSTDSDNSFGAYCELQGHTNPVNASAPAIQWQVNLPNNWNNKAIHFGGSGFDGKLIDGKERVRLSASSSTPPLALGYATYGDDSGHEAEEITDGSFALNDEALANFGRDALKKTRDVAVELMKARYGSAATRSYFLGTSTGGRDALTYLQHWPTDYQGAIVNQPALNYTGVRMSNVYIGRALYANGGAGWVNLEKTLLLQQTVIDQCDMLDGVADGVVSNVEACRQKNEKILAMLRCPDGTDTDDTCLSDAQIQTVRVIDSPMQLRSYSLPNSVVRVEGYNFLEGTRIANGDRSLGTRAVPSTPPDKDLDANLFFTGDQWARYFLKRNASFNSLTFDPLNPGADLSRVQTLANLTDATNPNMSGFFANGGKLILLHGLADEVIPTQSTIAFFQRMTATMGATVMTNSVRFYTVPGMGHGTGVFKPAWDSLGALEKWVENGVAPAAPVVADTAQAGRSRPLCQYPAWPKYLGSGSVNAASSYSCVQETAAPPACANLPAVTTLFRGGDTWGEELRVSVNPATLDYTLTVVASLQRAAGTARSGKLAPRGECTYASSENGAVFSFGAGGVLQGAIATPSGNNYLPLVAFRDTTSNFIDIANIYNATGITFNGGTTGSAWNGSTRFRSTAATWQSCQGSGAGFITYDAACAATTKGYVAFNASRGSFDLFNTPPADPATTTGGTLTGSVVGGLVNGNAVPLLLLRASPNSYGLRLHAPQVAIANSALDGIYATSSVAGNATLASIDGTDVDNAASTGTLSYNNPVAGVVRSNGGYAGFLIGNGGLLAAGNGAAFELGVRR